tara:strand:- start:164 stop:1912 length:1749 start_codon:yes stop_codon:yes gene_type:complete
MRKRKKKKLIKKRIGRKRNLKSHSSVGLYVFLSFLLLLGLFSETVRTIPAGAFSEISINRSIKLTDLNSKLIEKKALKISLLDKRVKDIEISKNEIETKSQNLIQKEEKKQELIVAKVPENKTEKNNIKIINENKIEKVIVDVPKIEEKIKLADTSTTTITVDGEEKVIAGSSDKNITYMQILQKPNDLDLNLKYAQQQGKIGNFKQTIATLERLNMIYPDNIEIKLYLLSVLVQADSPNKALTVIEEIKSNEDVTAEDLETVSEIEEEMKARGAPKLWNFYADAGIGVIQNNNVNSVSKTRRQYSSDSIIGFNSAMFDRTYSASLGLTATRAIGEASSFMLNTSYSDSRQSVDTSDDFQSYGLMLGLDTAIGNQSLSPYFMLSKTDYQDDADSFSFMGGIGGFFPVGDKHTFSYGYSYSDSKGNKNNTDTTANETNAIGHGITLGHDYMVNDIISTSIGTGASISEAKVGTNDFYTYELNFRVNFAFPWAYISVGDALGFNDYVHVDESTTSKKKRSDVTNTFDIMVTKAVGDLFPFIDRNKSLFINLAYEKIYSEANMMNYDYISDSVSISFSKALHLNK